MKQRRMGMGRIFQRRSSATGKKLPIYWVAYYVKDEHGRRREVRVSAETEDHEEAKQFLKKKLGEAADRGPKPIHLERTTVADLLTLFVRDYEDQGQAIPAGHVEALGSALGSLRALDVKRHHLDELARTWRKQGVSWPGRPCAWCRKPECTAADHQKARPLSAASCNRYMATLRRAFSLGREKLELDSSLTFPHLAETSRGRYIPPADFYAILGHIPSETKRLFCEFAYLTGVRKGQLRDTEIANVDAERWMVTWRPDQTKSGEPHVLPLVGRTKEIIMGLWARRRLDCRHLFHEEGRRLGLLRSEWNRACRKAGFPVGRQRGGYSFHDTRHSCISNLHAAGVPDSVAMSISNHKTPAVFLRYGIRHESAQRAALEQVDALLRGLEASSKVRPVTSERR